MKLITLTPIHIGSGETLKSLSYITDKNSLYVLNIDKFFALLSEDQRKKYLQWIDPIIDNLARLDEKINQAKNNWNLKRQLQNQRRELESRLSIGWFIKERLQQNPVNFAKGCLAYQIIFSSPPGRVGFKTHLKDPNNRVYIPGTEIKGAIRTSLLYSLLKDRENYEILRKSLKDFSSFFKGGASPREKIKRLTKIADAQSENGLERKFLRGKEKDAKYDLLKLINISDTSSVSLTQLQISTIRVVGTPRNIKIWAETINPYTEFHFTLKVHKKIFLNKLGLGRLKDWLSISKLFEACYFRSKEMLEEEEKYFVGEKNILETISKLKKENHPNAPLLRLGWGQGFLGTTIGLKVKQNDPDLYDEAIREGVSFARRWRTQRANFPKTRRVIIDGIGNAISLLGWVKLVED